MLTSLLIRNVALIDELRIELQPGLTTITGETGAGKSILIDALGLALGERADTTMIRDGAERAVVEAEFNALELGFLQATVESLGAEWQPMLILRRELPARGNSRCFINDSPVTVAALRELGDALVDIHGQHEHQSLLRVEQHVEIVDELGGLEPLRTEYRFRLDGFIRALEELEQAVERRDRADERRVVLEHQARELAALDPKPGEDEAIERELRIVEQTERISALIVATLDVLYDGDGNVVDALGRTNRLVGELAGIDPSLTPLTSELDAAHADVSDVARTLRNYLERLEFQPERCEELRHRLAVLTDMKRKYRCTMDELVARREELQRELAGLEHIDDHIAGLERTVTTAREYASAQARKLSDARRKTAKQLGAAVVRELRDLGLPTTRFDTVFEPRRAAPGDPRHLLVDGMALVPLEHGCDLVEFLITTNVGEDLKPLARVVSGGEVSRIMLAIKAICAGKSRVPVLVFDEIDTGVSGPVARRVGLAMRRLAAHHQIVAITHLPQIAGAGSAQLVVEKQVSAKRTVTSVRRLTREERIREIARLMSGDAITDAALRGAAELMTID